jgi:phosphoglycolate phosphatase-like HAD superfamily hydrolase
MGNVAFVLSRLLILDIDGTLLHTGGAGLRSFRKAAEAVFSRPITFTKHDFAGKLDCLIFRKLHAAHSGGKTSLPEAWAEFQRRYVESLAEESQDSSSWKVYPGVREFLEKESGGSLLALLTGNIRKGAEIKLKTVGLWDFFPCGAFGDAGEDRSCLAAAALLVSKAYYQREFTEVWVIGDTIADIECGKSIGAKTLGVRTGFSADGELEAAGADRVVRTLEWASFYPHPWV